jgi:hypothetical protein
MPNADYFLKEKWKEKAQEERPEIKKWPFDIFDLEQMAEKIKDKKAKEEFSLVLKWLKDSCQNYVHVCEKLVAAHRDLEEQKGDRESLNKSLELAEEARRRCHHIIFDNLNILARLCKKYNLSTEWRNYFGDEKNKNDWNRTGEWAYEMGQLLTKQKNEEE